MKKLPTLGEKPSKMDFVFHVTTSVLAISTTLLLCYIIAELCLMFIDYMARLFSSVKFIVHIQTFKNNCEPRSLRDNLPLV